MSYQVIWESKRIILRFFGCLTRNDLFQSVSTIHSDERFDSIRHAIADLLGVTGFSVTGDDMKERSAIDHAASRSNPYIRFAVIAGDSEIIDLVSQYTLSPFNACQFGVFSTRAEARAWLGLANSTHLSIFHPDGDRRARLSGMLRLPDIQ
ncbi:MAG: hypothetical protein WCK63_02645 [Betaproteobacteria bacterium]